jgi:V8-like Glu-specific endopeptidase
MRTLVTLLTGGALAITTLALANPAEAAPPADNPGAEHRRIVEYWTPERVAAAQPADRVVDTKGRTAPAARGGGGTKGKPGGGGDSGGGGTTTSVLGASWTGGGEVLKTTGKVLFTLGSSNYVCSASLVNDGVAGRAVAATAGHCVYDERNGKFATNWMFVPAFDSAPTFTCSSTAYGCWTATSLVTTTAWSGGDFNGDIGFAVLGAGGKNNAQADDVVGSQAIAFNTVHPTFVHAFGYPAEGKYAGSDLVYCAGTDSADRYSSSSTTYGVSCDLNGGSSGGPWFRDFNVSTGIGTVTSVNSYTYRGVKNRMFGPYLGTLAANTFAKATTTTSNALVG